MKNLKWAILGPGTIAEDFAKAIKSSNGELYAVGSRSLERAEAFKEKHGAKKAYGNYSEMLKDENIDVVYISTPHSNHYQYIMESLNNNKHVLCEKAITINGEELKEAVSLAKEKNLVLEEAMTIYHMPLYKKLKGIIEDGSLGKIKMIQASFGSLKEDDKNNRFFSKELAGGALLDIGTYAISFVRSFLGEKPNEIVSLGKSFETGVDEQSGIVLKNSKDEMAVISLTFRAKMPKRGVVACENGFITVDDYPRAEKATITYFNGKVEEIVEKSEDALLYEVRFMEERIINGVDSKTLNYSLDVMEIMDEVRRQWK